MRLYNEQNVCTHSYEITMSPTSESLFVPYENSDLSWIRVHPNVHLPSSLCCAGLATFLTLAVDKPELTSYIKEKSSYLTYVRAPYDENGIYLPSKSKIPLFTSSAQRPRNSAVISCAKFDHIVCLCTAISAFFRNFLRSRAILAF